MNFSSRIWLQRLSKTTVLLTLLLIFVGALVKSHEVGLSVPDWPTTYGKQMFAFPVSEMVGGIFYEHGHRMMATFVGFITLMQAVLLGFSDQPKWIIKLGYISLILVITQGILGGITVLYFLPPVISIIHGILAQTFFLFTILIAYGLSSERTNREDSGYTKSLRKISFIIISMGYIQLILGALTRHTASGLAIPDFPTMGGLWIPTFSESMINNINVMLFDLDLDMIERYQVIIHFSHRLGAFIITFTIGYFFVRYKNIIKEYHHIYKTFIFFSVILLIQLSLGILTVLSERSPYISSFHVLTGAALLGLSLLFVLRTYPIKFRDW